MSKQTKDIPKGYKMTELGPLPEEWEVESVENVTEFSKKPRDLKIPETEDVIFIPMEVIPDNGSEITKWEYRKYKNISSGSFVRKGDFVVAKITPSFENGKQALLDNLPAEYAYATTEVWALHANSKGSIHLPFLYNYIRLPSIRGEVAGAMEGSTGRQRVPKHVIAKLKIPLPPLPEQKKIASVLSAVQQAKEKTEGVIAALRVLKKSLMKHLFTYGPVPVDEAENVELKETEIGPLPEEWRILKVGDYTNVRGGYGFPHRYQGNSEGSYPFYKVSDMNLPGNELRMSKSNNYINGSTLKELKAKPFPTATIIFPKIGAAIHTNKKRILTRPSLVDNNVMGVTITQNDLCDGMFLLYYFHTINLTEICNNGPLPSINGRTIKELRIPLPPLPEQKKIANMLSSIDTKLDTLENEKRALDDLFRTLLHDLMTARIRVNEAEVPV